MSLDPRRLAELVREYGLVARVVVAGVQGSAPRETGAAVLVWLSGQEGTIGGGALEYQAVEAARTALIGAREAGEAQRAAKGAELAAPQEAQLGAALPEARLASDLPDALAPLVHDRALRIPLGPALGQCCGGAVTLLTEFFDAARVAALTGEVYARPLAPEPQTEPPGKVARRLEAIRNGSFQPVSEVLQGWLIEPLGRAGAPLWIWGAGHVGRALVEVLAPLPFWRLTWADTGPDRFPADIPPGVEALPAADLPALARQAPQDAHHLILTYSHEIDLALCHALLGHGFATLGLIGSDTKWARFRSRLQQLGHAPDEIARISCPIGRKSYGKHPQAIAIGVAADLLWAQTTYKPAKDEMG